MAENKRKMSVISEFVIFLVFVLLSVIILNKNQNTSNNIINNNSYEDIEFENKMYIKNIRENYGINVISGDDSKELCMNVEANVQYNINILNSNLKSISKELEKYPEEVFDIFKNKKYPLKVIILESFNNNNLALTSKSTLNEFKIYLSNTEKFEKALHHEMYHVLEYYITDTHKYIYSSWYKLNPKDFKYVSNIDNIDYEYVYMNLKKIDQEEVDIYSNNDNPYFVTLYSKSTEREDRAEIFSEIMIQKAKPSYLNVGQNILQKVFFMDNVIKECITNDDFYYTKYIY